MPARLLLLLTSHAQHQTPDELTREVERARDEATVITAFIESALSMVP